MHSLFDQSRAEAEQPGADAALHGAFGLFQQQRDLAIRVPAEIRQLDGVSFAVRQRRERAPDGLPLSEIQDLAFEVDFDAV